MKGKFWLNKLIENKDGSKRFRIVEHKEKFISKRVWKYETPMGGSSVGVEVVYDDFEIALESENKWLDQN